MTKKNIFKFYKKLISTTLIFALLINSNAGAFTNIEFIPESELQRELQAEIKTVIQDSVKEPIEENKTPQEFLIDLLKNLEETAQEDNNKETNHSEYNKLSKEDFTALYNKSVNDEYTNNTKKIENQAKEALDAFDEESRKVINEQKHIFNTDMPILNFKMSPDKGMFNKGKTFHTIGQSDTTSIAQTMNNIKSQEAILTKMNESIAEQRNEYIEEINTWKESNFSALNKEKNELLSNIDNAYDEYSQEYDIKLNEFYSSLVKEIIENFKQTNDTESKKNFVSILFFLTFIKSPEIDRINFIKGEEKKFILDFLQSNFSIESNACASQIKTTYKDNYNYGSSAIGGSPSAGKIFDNSASKTAYLEIEDQEKCDLALSSMMPYANLNGDGHAIADFAKQYYDQPLFGSILEMAVKSLLLTENKGEEALSEFIDESINLENNARAGKTSTWGKVWDKLDFLTFEGIARNSLYDDKFCHHNLCSSGSSNVSDPNVWEEIAYMLADAQKTDLLNKAIDQCKIVSTKNYYQHIECQGIYPFLLGALVSKPELANRIRTLRPFSESQGQEIDKNGRIHNITSEDAKKNKTRNDYYDITKRHTQGEWIASLFTLQSFEDLYPDNMLRINNLIADTPFLNSKNDFHHYDKNSDWYQTRVKRFNRKQILLPLASYTDFLISIIAVKDLLHFGFTLTRKTVNAAKMMIVMRTVKEMPNSFSKAVKIARLLEMKKLSPSTFVNFAKFSNKPLVYITGKMSAAASKTGLAKRALLVNVSGKITGVKNDVLIGTREIAHPLFNPKSKVSFKMTPLGGKYVASGADAFKVTTAAEPTSFKGAMSKIRKSIAESPFNPFIKPDTKNFPSLDLEGLTLEVVDKKGNPIKIEKITIEDNLLYVNGEMFKTFKATLPEDQLEIISNLVKKHNIDLGIDGIYVKPLWKATPSAFEKASARWHNSEFFNIYDAKGNVIMQLGLNKGFKRDFKLINELGDSAKLVYTNDVLFLKKGANLTRLEGLQGLSLPKKSIFNMAKNSKVSFLNDLFKMPLRADKTSPLKFTKTGSKILWPYITQALSYSAASTSLMMTMEKEPFNFSPAESVTIGLFLPYVWSFASPLMVPLVRMWGAKPVLLGSLAFASTGLGLAIANGYHGNVTNELDSEGRVIHKLDENGNEIKNAYKIRKDHLPTWPLFVASAFTGIASAGVRASSNILIKSYELNRTTMTTSMLFKNVGGMAFTLFPFLANSLARMDNDTFRDKRKDFSYTYPALLFLTLVAGTGIALKMPKMNVPNYRPTTADFFSKPWKLLFTKQVAPYTIGMMGVCSLEGYAYFKGTSAFARDTFENYGIQAESAKFLASVFTALPQFLLRLKSPRKVSYGYGLFNSAMLATTGTFLLMLPSDNLSTTENTLIGIAAGTALGLGTAQVYQYSQNLVLSQAKNIAHASDIQTLYSMSNLGLALPSAYAISANKRKNKLNESEFEATKNTLYWPLIFYLMGVSAIADAERGFKVFPLAMKNLVKPALRYSIEGSSLNRTIINSTNYFKPTLQPNIQFTPNIQVMPNNLKLVPINNISHEQMNEGETIIVEDNLEKEQTE